MIPPEIPNINGNCQINSFLESGSAIDPSQGINNGSLELINYVDPVVSLLLLVGLSILLLLIGIIRFKKREITN